MKSSSLSLALSAAAILLASAAFTLTSVAQAPPAQPPAGSPPPPRSFPAPTNLKVLPKNYTAQQVHDTMEIWAGSLGTHCDHCHAEDPKKVGPNGRPRLNFADDSKPEKAAARLMYAMTEDINVKYLSRIPNSDMPITCGTCHRGRLSPQPFVLPEEDHPGPPPAGAAPPTQH